MQAKKNFFSLASKKYEKEREKSEKIATLECERRFIIKPNSNFFALFLTPPIFHLTQTTTSAVKSLILIPLAMESLCMHFRYFFSYGFFHTQHFFVAFLKESGNYTNTNDSREREKRNRKSNVVCA